MRNRTQAIRTAELIRAVNNHKHKEELIDMMYQQLQDDSHVIKA